MAAALGVGVLAWTAAACSDFQLDERRFACAVDSDCASGFVCGKASDAARVCVDDGSGTTLPVSTPCDLARAEIGCLDAASCEWACVAATDVWVGCNQTLDGVCAVRPEEQPARRVEAAAFLVHRSEVSRGAFAEHFSDASVPCSGAAERLGSAAGSPLVCDSDTGQWSPDGDTAVLPMTRVRWIDAMAFCARRDATLCTESQWELAARGGCELHGEDCDEAMPPYPWGAEPISCGRANSAGCEGSLRSVQRQSAAAGASPYGVIDALGNAAEWVFDCWHPSYQGAPLTDGPWVSGCGQRVIRGGSYRDPADDLRGSARKGAAPTETLPDVGFRCCRRLGH